jgi:Flp pilus assembly secretin CpaC
MKATKRMQYAIRGGIALAALIAAAAAPAKAESLTVLIDQAKLVRLPERMAAVIVGNPLIADATLQAGGTMVLTGKSYGTTNVMAIDRAGEVLMQRTVQVQAPQGLVVVHRGTARQTYSCTPACERQIMLGDDKEAFTAILGQTAARSGQAQNAPK